MGRRPTSAEDKKIKKRARQQRYRAKKRALLQKDTAQLSPSEPPAAAPNQRVLPPTQWTLSTTCYQPGTNGFYGTNFERFRCPLSGLTTEAVTIDRVHSKGAGDLAMGSLSVHIVIDRSWIPPPACSLKRESGNDCRMEIVRWQLTAIPHNGSQHGAPAQSL